MNHPVIDTRLDTCQSPARAPCTAQHSTAQHSTTISQGFCCPNLKKQVLRLQTVAGGGAGGGDTGHVTRGCTPDTASSSAAGGGTLQLVALHWEARDSWQTCEARGTRHVSPDRHSNSCAGRSWGQSG